VVVREDGVVVREAGGEPKPCSKCTPRTPTTCQGSPDQRRRALLHERIAQSTVAVRTPRFATEVHDPSQAAARVTSPRSRDRISEPPPASGLTCRTPGRLPTQAQRAPPVRRHPPGVASRPRNTSTVSRAPRPSVETPRPSVETPRPSVETPRPSVETPRPPVETPRPPVGTTSTVSRNTSTASRNHLDPSVETP
jgi:hypothetical protein